MAMPQRDDSPTPRLRRTGTIEAIKRQPAEKKAAEEKEGRGACPRRVSSEAKAGSEVQIATLPADQQEPARKEWAKVLRPFKRREPWLCPDAVKV